MGIRDFYDVIKGNCPHIIETIHFSTFEGRTVAVDISVFLYKYVRTAGEGKWVDSFINLLLILKKYRIKAVCVFDGPNPPIEKQKERQRRKDENKKRKGTLQKAIDLLCELDTKYTPIDILDGEILERCKIILNRNRPRKGGSLSFDSVMNIKFGLEELIERLTKQTLEITKEIINKAKEIIRCFGLNQFQANGEAETLCSYLAIDGQVDAVLTEDTDVFVYGTPQTWVKINLFEKTFECINYKDILEGLEMSPEQFRDMCIMLGCDYNERIKGYGPKRIPPLIYEHQSIDGIKSNTKINIEPLNHERCRQLFDIKYHNFTDTFVGYNREIDIDGIAKILTEESCNINLDVILSAWQPTPLIFEDD